MAKLPWPGQDAVPAWLAVERIEAVLKIAPL